MTAARQDSGLFSPTMHGEAIAIPFNFEGPFSPGRWNAGEKSKTGFDASRKWIEWQAWLTRIAGRRHLAPRDQRGVSIEADRTWRFR
ncbi:hypothetical protein GCM10011499_38410 [Pelagibacterium lentulum]|uniref:Uncharacterized protein n=1 Tax=Pelagibacterium lentulum TaxID=2029865 RepID=A0A916RRH1_9HYPH|nr:hypothetical protein GCM10011499_38410 [Pelagibacterium lentulum]